MDPDIYGIALVTTDGRVYPAGDVAPEVSIQSISGVFTMAKVIEDQGADAFAVNMGLDATAQLFNSIVAVEQYKGAEMSTMVNGGCVPLTAFDCAICRVGCAISRDPCPRCKECYGSAHQFGPRVRAWSTVNTSDRGVGGWQWSMREAN